MNNKQNISITELTNAADTLNSLSDFEITRKRQEDNLSVENMNLYFKPWCIFINHIDSYHGKILTDVCIVYNYIYIYHIILDIKDLFRDLINLEAKFPTKVEGKL